MVRPQKSKRIRPSTAGKLRPSREQLAKNIPVLCEWVEKHEGLLQPPYYLDALGGKDA